ncbi:hypothetical protein [Dyadobacter chenhuakuii]|uniref:Uncharacterized protein n=1 Tax=Dyadobacter chenhuakuii TaxID=2909339 RepID=A0A9X1TWS2_9BACT|nr:hypothetical protein [Dyadobacter chenhuakuii]MCF2501683.1 hypothetical protein [Dyadobacter chenhuakuii]
MDLKTKFLSIVVQAEKLYGPRDGKFIINEVKIVDSPYSPQTIVEKKCLVNVNLSVSTNRFLNMAFEMYHEAVHCLNPCYREDCNYLEEAVAVHFSLKYVSVDLRYREVIEQHDRYREALHAFESVPGLSDEMIQQLRLGCRSLSGSTLLDLTTAGLENPDNEHLIKLISKAY